MSGRRAKALRRIAKDTDLVYWKIIYRDLKKAHKKGLV